MDNYAIQLGIPPKTTPARIVKVLIVNHLDLAWSSKSTKEGLVAFMPFALASERLVFPFE